MLHIKFIFQDIYEALTLKHQESLNYYAEIERLNAVVADVQKQLAAKSDSNRIAEEEEERNVEVVEEVATTTAAATLQSASRQDKAVIDNSNEILGLKAKIKELERRLNLEKFNKSSPGHR